MVMTAKHHEGFCLFDSKLTDYSAPRQGPGRDLVREFIEAARSENLRVGLYYSLMDWHHPHWTQAKSDSETRRRFVACTHGQIARADEQLRQNRYLMVRHAGSA
jgi:alpha-L-fucosidase